MKILLGIEGGAGKGLAATAAVHELNELGHQVDVLTAWPQMWIGNNDVNRVYEWAKGEYLTDQLQNYDQVVLDDPYRQSCFLKGECNLAETFAKMLDVELPENYKLYYEITKAEIEEIKAFVSQFEKPILAVQTNGGQHQGYAWTKDMPLTEAVEVLNDFANDYTIIHFRANGQLKIDGVPNTEELSIRQCIALLSLSEKRFLIDSVYQHAAVALGLESVVVWVATTPEQFGYDMHKNMLAHTPMLSNTHRLEILFPGLDIASDKCPWGADQTIIPIEETKTLLGNKQKAS